MREGGKVLIDPYLTSDHCLMNPLFNGTDHTRDDNCDFGDSLDNFDRHILAQYTDQQAVSTEPDSSSCRRLSSPEFSTGPVFNWQNSRHQRPLPPRIDLDARHQINADDSLICAHALSRSSPLSSALPGSKKELLALTGQKEDYNRAKHTHCEDPQNMPTVFSKRGLPNVTALESRHIPWAINSGLQNSGPLVQGIQLIPTNQLSDHLRSIFSFELFNAIQSKCFPQAFENGDNLVLCAPTGSGKTAIMELAICRLLTNSLDRDFKVVYQAPTKSLCSERHRDWTAKFSTVGLQCAELTGDVEFAQLRSVQAAHIIVTTPEKWDSVTRKWKDNVRLMRMIKLFLIDEVHILSETRGATLEAIVSRMKSVGSGVRFVALSATVPNSADVAKWLGLNSTTQCLAAHREVFGEQFRPVELDKHVIGYDCGLNAFALDAMLTKEVPIIIAHYGRKKPVMVFCITKNSAIKTATVLADLWLSTAPQSRLWKSPNIMTSSVNPDLQRLASAGVAFHHSALDATDRKFVEQGFVRGNIGVICCTSTLAVGVNLPCYLVVLKGTCCWSDKGLREYSSIDVMQMLGRAGRPQYEDSACAVILTHTEKVRHYQELASGQEILESALHKNLIEHLNAEIGTGTIENAETAKKWLASTFLSVRLRQNPDYYRLQGHTTTQTADQLLAQICERDLGLLKAEQLITTHGKLECTEYGEAMARYYIQYETMLILLKLPSKPTMSQILNVIAQSFPSQDLKLRSGEKTMYKQLNQANDIRYPVNVDIALPAHKASLIIQCYLGGVTLDKSMAKFSCQFRQDTMMVMNHANRLIRCIIDIQIHRKDAMAVKNALELCRSMAAGLWDNTPLQLKQIESVGDITARKLAAAGINTVQALLSTEPHRIEVILGKHQPFGSLLLKKASKFPSLRVSIKKVGQIKKTPSGNVEIHVKCEIGYMNESLPVTFNRNAVHICFLCETSNGVLVDFRRFAANRLRNGEQVLLTIVLDAPCNSINCHVACDQVAGTYCTARLSLEIPAAWFTCTINAGSNHPTNSRQKVKSRDIDCFDDDGLADDDFLAVMSNTGCVDEIKDDLDSILLSEENARREAKIKESKSIHLSEQTSGVSPTEFREPIKLPNGNWTCQHSCLEEHKECKHHCCKEGVKRPKRRVKQQKIISKKNPASAYAAAKPLNGVQSSQRNGHGNCNTIHSPIQYQETYGGNDQKGRVGPTHAVTDMLGCLTHRDSNQHYDVTDIDELSLEDLSSHEGTASPDVVEKKTRPCGTLTASHTERYDDNSSSSKKHERFVLGRSSTNQNRASESILKVPKTLVSSIPSAEEPFPSETPCSSEMTSTDLQPGCRLAMSLTGPSSESCRRHGNAANTDFNDPNSGNGGSDEFSTEIDTDLSDATLALIGGSMIPYQQMSTVMSGRQSLPMSGETDLEYCKTLTVQTDTERKQQICDEGQKQKWASLPDWLYEEYGAYVELI